MDRGRTRLSLGPGVRFLPSSGREYFAQREDELKERDRRIANLKDELDEARDLVQRQDEQIQQIEALLENWREGFNMSLGDDGLRHFNQFVQDANDDHDRYVALVRKWNQHVALFNDTVRRRNVGRPLAASEAQIKTVRQLRRRGVSLRDITEETSLGLRTVRTIINKQDSTDRTRIKHLERIDPERARERIWQGRRRCVNRYRAASPRWRRRTPSCASKPRG